MRAFLLKLLTLFLFVPAANGEVLINGYFEPQFTGTALGDEFFQLNSNKLRVDLDSRLSDETRFTGNFNYVNYNGRTTWNLVEFLPRGLAVAVREEDAQIYSLEYEDKGELDNAYLRLYVDYLTLTVGKQQISVGPGYVWNPTDLFNRKDLLDPTYEQPGVNGLRLDIGLSPDYTVLVFYSPQEAWRSSGKLLRFSGRASHFDYALSTGQMQEHHSDFILHHAKVRRREILGFDLNGEILGIGCWSENAYSSVESSHDYWESVIGLDYTFSSGCYLMGEYYHNGEGKGDESQYSLNDWLGYLTAESRTLARNQLYFHTTYPATDLLTLGTSVVFCASDDSVLLVPTCAYSVSDDMMLSFFGSVHTGKDGTMYSKQMGKGGIVRLRAYF